MENLNEIENLNEMKNLNRFQNKRIENIKSILKYYQEPDISDNIIKKINGKFKRTKHYNFIRTEQIEKGMIVRTVNLGITKLNIPGIVVKIQETSSKKYGKILLFNPLKKIFWNINPDKYYIFLVERNSNTQLNTMVDEMFQDYKNKIYNKIKP